MSGYVCFFRILDTFVFGLSCFTFIETASFFWMLKIVCSRICAFWCFFFFQIIGLHFSFILFSQQIQVCKKFNNEVLWSPKSLSPEKTGLSCNFDQIDTAMGSCFTITFIVSVGFSSSGGTQIDSKSKMATFFFFKLFFGILKTERSQFFE